MCREQRYEELGMVVLSNLSTRDVYETIEADHEYEILGKFNPTYVEIDAQAPSVKPESVQLQPLSSAGGFGFTQCPAYDPVATTSIHGNTKLDTPSIQPTTHQ